MLELDPPYACNRASTSAVHMPSGQQVSAAGATLTACVATDPAIPISKLAGKCPPISCESRESEPIPTQVFSWRIACFSAQDRGTRQREHCYLLSHICVFLLFFIFFCSCKSPYNKASAVGGQPGTYMSTGTIRSQPRTTEYE